MVHSGAGSGPAEPRAVLVERAVEELGRFFPESRAARPVAHTVVFEPRATFLGRPGQAARRAGPVTAVPNLFLAGDATATGLPATIEGAVQSGEAAAWAVMKPWRERSAG